jgi:cytochrome c-type biogenesis protein CcmE
MTRKQRRAPMIGGGVATLVVASLLVMLALRDKVVFFHSPSDVVEKKVPAGQRFRLGGLVQQGSVKRGGGVQVEFAVTDTIRTIPVTYDGILPDLFREGQGVVTEGKLDAAGRFTADTVLAKHDETYMPPEVAKALKDKGVELGKTAATHKGPSGPAATSAITGSNPAPVKAN